MTKCDFCIYSSPDKKCFWTVQSYREEFCKEAIKEMKETFKNINVDEH